MEIWHRRRMAENVNVVKAALHEDIIRINNKERKKYEKRRFEHM